MALIISPKIAAKLADDKHGVTREEIEQCFITRTGNFVIDEDEEHATDPPTKWFVSETEFGRKLKIIFVFRDGNIFLKSAYNANQKTIKIYNIRGYE